LHATLVVVGARKTNSRLGSAIEIETERGRERGTEREPRGGLKLANCIARRGQRKRKGKKD